MRSRLALAIGAVVLLATGRPAHAELVHWSYTWSAIPDVVEADAPGTGKIFLDKQATGQVESDILTEPETDLVATNLRTVSTATALKPDRFTNAPFVLTLKIKDADSNESETLFFHGVFNGPLTAMSSKVRPKLNPEDIEQAVKLGKYLYTVTMTGIVPPGPPTSTNQGSIGAKAVVKVTEIDGVEKVPEPGTLLSALVAVGVFWLALARRRPAFSF